MIIIIIIIIIEKKIKSSKHIVAVNQKILRPANFPETLQKLPETFQKLS